MYFLHPVREDRLKYRDWLLEADPSEEMLQKYLDRGTMYVLEIEGREVAEAIVTEEGDGLCEIQNISVAREERKKGNGSLLLQNLIFLYAQKCDTMRVCTDLPLEPFYKRQGFVRTGMEEGYFTSHYSKPIYEGDVLCTDRVILERSLKIGCTCTEEERAEKSRLAREAEEREKLNGK